MPATRNLALVPKPEVATAASSERMATRALMLIVGAAIATVAGGALVAALASFSPSGEVLVTIALVTVLGMSAERLDIHVYGDGRVSVSALFMVAAAVLFGPVAVLLVCPPVALAGHLRRGRPLHKLVFNLSVFVLAALASAYGYRLASSLMPYHTRPFEAVAVIAAALAHFGVSSVLVAAIIAYTGPTSVRREWSEKFAWLLPHFVVLGFLAFLLTVAYRELAGYGLLGFTLPVLMTRFTMKQYVERTERTVGELREKNREIETLSDELAEAYNDTLLAVVAALDLRDTETHGHSTRVAELSLEISRILGVQPGSREWQNLKHGAILHDVGKIGVSDAILRKPGRLDDDEWTLMRQHPEYGYRMLAGVPFLSGAAELVRAHHERYDGGGYPRGLHGEEIPLAARIFAVADAYDAITSDRPYQTARSDGEACAEIARHSGTQFDRRVVEALLNVKQRASRAA